MQPKTLSEHEGVQNPNLEDAVRQTDEEREAVKLVERHLSDAKRARSTHDQKWMENYRFFRGQQWKDKRPSYRHSEVLNYIFSEVQTVLVILSDTRPRIETLPEDPSDYEFSEIINKTLTSKWDVYQWSYVVAEAIIDAAVYGTAIGEVPWKPDLLDGLGDLGFETVDPTCCYPDPNTRSKINSEYCKYFLTAVPTDITKVKKDYPHVADKIKPDIAELGGANFDPYDTEEMRLKSPLDNRVLIEEFRPNRRGLQNQVLLLTDYMHDDAMIEEQIGEETDPITGLVSAKYQSRKKYPNGRKIVVANGILCSDGENPYINGSLPYGRLVDHIMPREFWGIGEVEQLKSPQQIVNKVMSYALDVLTLMGNPIWVVDNTSGIETDNITNQPGLVVEKNPGSDVRRESGAQLQPFVLDIFQTMTERVMGKLGSTSDVSKGISPSPNASGVAIEQLQEASQTKLRGKSRNIEFFLKEIGDLMVDRILQFYTVPRIVRLTNDANAAKYFKFAITDVQDETGETRKVATIQNYEADPATGQQIAGPPQQVELKSKLDIRMSIGSALPLAKAQKAAQARDLFDKGIIDAEEYLNQIEYPNKEKIIKRLQDKNGGSTFVGQGGQVAPPQPQGAMQ